MSILLALALALAPPGIHTVRGVISGATIAGVAAFEADNDNGTPRCLATAVSFVCEVTTAQGVAPEITLFYTPAAGRCLPTPIRVAATVDGGPPLLIDSGETVAPAYHCVYLPEVLHG